VTATLVQQPSTTAPQSETDCVQRVVEEIRGMLNQWGLPADHLDRRFRQRFPYPHLIRITPVGLNNQPTETTLVGSGRDISLYGVGFYLPAPLPYQKAVLTFHRSPHAELSILTELDWCRFTRFGWYENGGRFLRVVQL
jgi:hypothetical protein